MLRRILKYETTVKLPLQNFPDPVGKPRLGRYQLHRRGKIARLLKPKRKRDDGESAGPCKSK